MLLAISSLALAPPAGAQENDNTLIAVGDMADCTNENGVEKVAAVLERTPGTIAGLGDLVYPNGSRQDFDTCFLPWFGDVVERFRPAPGNHEYNTPGATGYFDAFGSAAGPDRNGWYAYEIAGWQVLSLNSNCWEIGGCEPGSPQFEWLAAELATRPDACRVAYWHHPRYSSSGTHANAENMAPLVELLTDAGTEVILAGHAHHYERFAALGTDGLPDTNGPRFFTVGTGGTHPRGFSAVEPGSEVRRSGVYGALVLTLEPNSWSWLFRAEGADFEDSGTESCQNALDRPQNEPAADPIPLWHLYRAAFDRQPDAGGLDFWTQQVRSGTSLLYVARAFAASPEFSDRYGNPSDADFLRLLYLNVLDREPDPGGFEFWIDQLRTRTRAELLLEFSWSVEFRAG